MNTLGVGDHRDPDDTRPEPVKYAAQIGGLLSALLVAIGGVVVIFQDGFDLNDLGALGVALGGVIVAAVALGVYLLPVLTALKLARPKVTPLESPRNSDGTPLMAVPGLSNGPTP